MADGRVLGFEDNGPYYHAVIRRLKNCVARLIHYPRHSGRRGWHTDPCGIYLGAALEAINNHHSSGHDT